jgi:hypothetical protein
MPHDLTTEAGIVDAVHDLLCDHGWGHERDGGPSGLASEEIPGRVADVIAELARLRALVRQAAREAHAAGLACLTDCYAADRIADRLLREADRAAAVRQLQELAPDLNPEEHMRAMRGEVAMPTDPPRRRARARRRA